MNHTQWSRGQESDLYQLLAEMTAAGRDGVLVTVIGSRRSTPRHLGSKMIVYPDGKVTGSVGGGRAEALVINEARRVLADGKCRRYSLALQGDVAACGGELEVFMEPVGNSLPFWIVGAGHVGRAVVRLGAELPFRFVLVDDRPEFLAGVNGAETLEADPKALAESLTVTSHTAVLIASRSHELDADYLDAVLRVEAEAHQEVSYLGVIGSRTKAANLAARFGTDAQFKERWQRIQMPVGLAIGAETPAEIALSILAEVLPVMRGVPLINRDQEVPVGVYLHRHSPRPDAATPDEPE
jgi:xanthine dehydrogenase accessory factor